MITMERLLTETPLAQARPEVLVACEREITWVHSSEIYEIAPLLDGGEALLTTGLGLVGARGAQLSAYVEGIAAAGAAAIVLELGRTFVQVPPTMVEDCRRVGLGLVVLHAVVPFVRIGRVANELILDHEADGLRRAVALAGACADVLARRRGIRMLTDAIAAHARTAIRLEDAAGRTHAGVDHLDVPVVELEIAHADGVWGRLVAHDTGDPHLRRILERGVDAVTVALVDLGVGGRADPRRALLVDLVQGGVHDPEEVARRATVLGLRLDQPVTGVVVALSTETTAHAVLAPVTAAMRDRVRVDLVAATEDGVLAVVDASASQRAAAASLLEALDARLERELGGIRHLAVGTAVSRLDQVPEAFGAALAAVATARELGLADRLLLPGDLALHRLLLESDDASLERLVTRTLGPLLEHDATHRGALLPTLSAYLGTGRSKAATAERLGVRRQTVYERLERIVRMLDVPADDPAAMTALEVATLAWRVRAAGGGGR